MEESPRSPETENSGWYVWLFPVIALILSGWLLFQYIQERGPAIQIHFEDGSGIQAEKTKVRFRGVTIGTVKKVVISEDEKEVIATVDLQKDAERFAVEGSKFWVVLPKVNLQGISGLETLFEGAYIAAEPGRRDGKAAFTFLGRRGSDISEPLEDTVPYFLEAQNAGSLVAGDSVNFRGFQVGAVAKVNLNRTAQTVIVQINVHSKYTKLIRANSVFWKSEAVQANIGFFKSEVKIAPLESLLHGGVDFFTPDPPGEVVKPHSHFNLFPTPPKGWETARPDLELWGAAKLKN